jgi:hypothetical protein
MSSKKGIIKKEFAPSSSQIKLVEKERELHIKEKTKSYNWDIVNSF